jgi:di/tripeptidase
MIESFEIAVMKREKDETLPGQLPFGQNWIWITGHEEGKGRNAAVPESYHFSTDLVDYLQVCKQR